MTNQERVDFVATMLEWLENFPNHEQVGDVRFDLASIKMQFPEVYAEGEARFAATQQARQACPQDCGGTGVFDYEGRRRVCACPAGELRMRGGFVATSVVRSERV